MNNPILKNAVSLLKCRPINNILRNIVDRVQNEKISSGYSRMHHRHSRTGPGPERPSPDETSEIR